MSLKVMTIEQREQERFNAKTDAEIKTLFKMRSEFRNDMNMKLNRIETRQTGEIIAIFLTMLGVFFNIIAG